MSPQKMTQFQNLFNCKAIQSNPFENIFIPISSKLNSIQFVDTGCYSYVGGFPFSREKCSLAIFNCAGGRPRRSSSLTYTQ
jgi:hypothetical protein